MNYYLWAQTAEKTVLNYAASKVTILRLFMSILLAPFNGKVNVIFYDDLTFHNKSAIAPTRDIYLTI